MKVRTEAPEDAAQVRAVVEAAFGQSDEADLVDRLRADGDAVISLVAEVGGEVVGHVLLSRLRAPERMLGLAPVSTRPDRQGGGVAAALIREALHRAGEEGWKAVFVVGMPNYYRRFGFDPALARGFETPYAGPYLMALELVPGGLPSGGRLAYARAFDDLA